MRDMTDKYYDSIAKGYNELHGDEQKKKLDIIRNNIKIRPKTRILDIGCGTGISMDFSCYCIGIDPSKELIRIAKNNDKNPKHEYRIGKAENVADFAFHDEEFDYVISISAIHHFNNLENVLNEIQRIGKGYIFTILKRSPRKQKIINIIDAKFNIKKKIEEEKDIILFCEEK